VRFKLQLGPAVLEVTAHVLPEVLDRVQLILGEDFMSSHAVQLSYSPSRCTLYANIPADQVVLYPISKFVSRANIPATE